MYDFPLFYFLFFAFHFKFYCWGCLGVEVINLSLDRAMVQHICKAQYMMMLLAFAIFGFAVGVGAFYCHQHHHHHISKPKLSIAHALSARNQTHLTLLNKISVCVDLFPTPAFSLTVFHSLCLFCPIIHFLFYFHARENPGVDTFIHLCESVSNITNMHQICIYILNDRNVAKLT